MKITKHAEFEVDRPPEEVFDFATSCEGFPQFLLPLGPLPGVASSRMLNADAPRTGARRLVALTDGGEITEELVAYDRPTRHRYRWVDNNLRPPFAWLARKGEGDWTFHATERGTRIVWDYHLHLTSRLVYPLAAPVAAAVRRWMQRGLERLPEALGSR